MEDNVGNIEMWTGRWRWNAETTVFSDPAHSHAWTEQFQEVTAEHGKLAIRNDQVFADGSHSIWTFEGALDGTPRAVYLNDGTLMMVIAFMQLEELRAADAYFAPDGSFAGSEYFLISEENVRVWGCATSHGKQHPYFEEWDRVG